MTHFLTSLAMRFLENSRSASAVSTRLPRIICASRLSFCGEMRRFLATAFASSSASARSRFGLPIFVAFSSLPCCSCRRDLRPHGLLIAAVPMKSPRRREFAELVADHVLGHADGNVLLPVVDAEGQPHELRQDGGPPAPDADDFIAAGVAHGLGLLQQITVDEWTLRD